VNETAATLRAKPGADITKLKPGTVIWAETQDGVYKIMVTGEEVGHVVVESTVLPLRPARPLRLILEKSIYDDKGKVFVMHWVAKGLRMLLRGRQGSFMTQSVRSLSVEAYDGAWRYEL